MKINKHTKIYFSVSSFPSNRGSILHNFLFSAFSINAIYIPLRIKKLETFISFVKEISQNMGGFSVSMPFKKKIIKYLSTKSYEVKNTLSCNTVVFKNGKLIGYNTDYFAIFESLKRFKNLRKKKIQILGNGATCKTVLVILQKLGFRKLYIFSRKRGSSSTKNISHLPWKDRNKDNFEMLINTTPIGMNNFKIDDAPILDKKIKEKKVIIDFPIPLKKKSTLNIKSNKYGVKYISGKDLHFLQGIEQAQIYLGKKIGLKLLKTVKRNIY